MSRIGKEPVKIPAGVSADVVGQTITIKGPKGEIAFAAPSCIALAVENDLVKVSRVEQSKLGKTMFGTARSTINNMVLGVSEGYRKELVIEGVGYKAVLQGTTLLLSLGFSHEIKYEVPDGIKCELKGATAISIEGIDKHLVGQVAARIRDFAPAEPYKGKGVRYLNEKIRRKEGKAVA